MVILLSCLGWNFFLTSRADQARFNGLLNVTIITGSVDNLDLSQQTFFLMADKERLGGLMVDIVNIY